MDSYPSQARRVLVVDDNRDAADTLSFMLGVLGHETAVAYCGADALSTLVKFPADVAILDIGMPGMNGFDLAQAIRRLPGCAHITLIALSGWDDAATRARSQQAGFDVHLAKPASMDELDELLQGRSLTLPQPRYR